MNMALSSPQSLSSPSPWHRLITSICRLEAVGLASSQMVLTDRTCQIILLERSSVLLLLCMWWERFLVGMCAVSCDPFYEYDCI